MRHLKLFVLFACCCLAVGCTAAKQEAATTTASTEWRLQSLEESFLNFKEQQRLQADRNAENAEELGRKIEALEAQVAAVQEGRMTMAAPDDVKDMSPEDKGWVTDLKPEDDNWVEGGKPADSMESSKAMAESGEEKPWAEVPGPTESIPEPKVIKRQASVAPKAPKPKAPMKSGSQVMYDRGLAKYNAGDFTGARGVFDEFLKKYPKDQLVPNVLYWKGETFYSQKDYAQSILTFKEVTARFPKHSKAAAALLKIGMSYDKVGDPDNAVFYLRALVEDFPSSSPAALARKELKRLGG